MEEESWSLDLIFQTGEVVKDFVRIRRRRLKFGRFKSIDVILILVLVFVFNFFICFRFECFLVVRVLRSFE